MKGRLTQLHTQPQITERDWTVDGIPVLHARAEIPLPLGTTAVHRRIRRYYQTQARAFLRYCEGWLFPQAQAEYRSALAVSAPLPYFHAALSYCVTYQEDGIWSLYTQMCEQTAASSLLTRWGDTWDLGTGYPVMLSAFLGRGSWRRRLLSAAAGELERQERSGIMRYDPQWRKKLRRSFNPRRYYLTPEGLVLFFPIGALSPLPVIPAVCIPYRQLGLHDPGRTAPV